MRGSLFISLIVHSFLEQMNSIKTRENSVKCQICGDKDSSPHFGVISCRPCKMFFKRNAEYIHVSEYLFCFNRYRYSNRNYRNVPWVNIVMLLFIIDMFVHHVD